MNDIYINVSQSDELEWVRPSDWLPMPEMVEGEQKVAGLYAVWGGGSDFCAMLCEGNYHVNWGDGVEEDVASGVKAQHIFNYNALAGTETSEGFRQAIVVITPQVGNNLTKIDLKQKHDLAQNNNISITCKEIKVVGENINSFVINTVSRYLKAFELVGSWNILDYSYFFYYCIELEKVILNTSNATNFSHMFENCIALKIMPELNFENATNLEYLFSYCYNLVKTKKIIANKNINLDAIFYYCYALKEVDEIRGALGANLNRLFYGCSNLKKYNITSSEILSCIGMFGLCQNIETINGINTSNVIDITSMAESCLTLKKIDGLSIKAGSTTFKICFECTNLSIVENCSFAESISFEYCLLSAEMLENIFNQLEVATDKIITITGNWGVPYLTQAQKDIAINKGWTIIE